jgi:hypothetical protein
MEAADMHGNGNGDSISGRARVLQGLLRRRVFSRPLWVVGALAGVLALVGTIVVIPLGSSSPPLAYAAGSASSAVTVRHPLVDGAGKSYPDASVTVSQTVDIQQRQSITVGWQGFEPSHGVTLAMGPSDLDHTEYPVVLVECWGTDTPQAPMDPTHCQGPGVTGVGGGHALGPNVYRVTSPTDASQGGVANPTDTKDGLGNFLGFTAVDGTHYKMDPSATGTDGVPPSLQLSADAFPDNALSTWSDEHGARSNVGFEVRGGSDLPVLGCSHTQMCTLEVIPILQPWCNPAVPSRPRLCPAGPRNPVGIHQATEPNPFLKGDSWWLGSQWRNRFSVPLSMAVPPGECPVVDKRPTVAVTGSEAATGLMGSWVPAFCLDPKGAFKLTHVNTPEDTARRSLTTKGPSGYGADGIFTSLPVTGSPRPVVHAPVGVTGWTVAYKIDDANNQEYRDLTLSPLLLAKLMTSSYRFGRSLDGPREPALVGNPNSLWADPEFKALNPNFQPAGGDGDMLSQSTFPNVIWDSLPSDALAMMFAYVDADPEARAWLNGKADAYSGMVVNPAFRSLPAPQMAIQLLDGWVQHSTTDHGAYSSCEYHSPIPWYTEIAQLSNSLENAALAVINRKPPFQICDSKQIPGAKPPNDWAYNWATNKISQNTGARQIIAFTTVSLAERYGLSMARLQSHAANSKPVAASGWENPTSDPQRVDTMLAALGYTKQDKATGVVSPDFSIFPFNAAYAGVMPVYAAIPTSGLDKALAAHYADLLDYAAGAGQTPGTSVGQLPWGYAPLPQAYRDYTHQAATAVRDQAGAVPAPPADLGGKVRKDLGLPAPGTAGAGGFSGASAPAGAGSPSTGRTPSGGPNRISTAATTRGSDSWLAGWGLPILLGLGLLAGVAGPLVRVAAQPGHPVRGFIVHSGHRAGAVFGRVASAVRRRSP